MITTVDRHGRVVVPKSLRDRFNFVAGTELEIGATEEGLTLHRVDSSPSLIRKKGILVHHGAARPNVDITEFIRAKRETRSRRTAASDPD